jgi:uncharacterized protein (TIGR04255 family)
VPAALQAKIKESFPFMQKKSAMAEQLQVISQTEIKRRHIKENHWFFQANEGGGTVCLAPNFLWIDYKKYSTFSDLKEGFANVVDGLFEAFPDFSANRFGLRYLNEIELTEPTLTEWEDYLSPDLLGIFALADDRTKICRAFHNLELNYEDANLTFLYGMHNADYPAPIKQKTFVLDFDAHALKVEEKDRLKSLLQFMHDKIEYLFERSITDKLREMMR